MRELVFALEFRGTARAEPGSTTRRRARTTAPSQVLRSVLGPDGVAARVTRVKGERAVLESLVERFADGGFVESGRITYGRAGTLFFATVGRGTVEPAPIAGWHRGAVIWVVTRGDGAFAGAQGLIVSNFTVSARGRVIDNHFTRLYLPVSPRSPRVARAGRRDRPRATGPSRTDRRRSASRPSGGRRPRG